MTYYQRAIVFPPALVRLLARNGREAMTSEQIWGRCTSLTRAEVEAISQSTSWDRINLWHIMEFTIACNVDLTDTPTMRRVYDYLRKEKSFAYLQRHPDWASYFKPLMIRWRQSYGVVTPTNPAGLWPPLRRLLIRLNPMIKV